MLLGKRLGPTLAATLAPNLAPTLAGSETTLLMASTSITLNKARTLTRTITLALLTPTLTLFLTFTLTRQAPAAVVCMLLRASSSLKTAPCSKATVRQRWGVRQRGCNPTWGVIGLAITT